MDFLVIGIIFITIAVIYINAQMPPKDPPTLNENQIITEFYLETVL